MAAGQGFKTFTTGEVLTAGDVNGYLMQGINVFTNATARDAAITAPAEGQFAFTKDNNSLWYYDGAAWVASGATGDIEGVTATSPLTGGGTSGTVTVGIQDASTSQRGSVQLSDSTATTSSVLAATPTAVKSAYDVAVAAIPKSTVTTSGDIIYATGSSTVTRLGVGSSGQVLTVSGGVPAWAAAPAAGKSWTLVASGSTTSGTSLNLTGLTTYDNYLLIHDSVSCGVSNDDLRHRFNNDASGVYDSMGTYATNQQNNNINANRVVNNFGILYTNTLAGYILQVSGCRSTTGYKTFTFNGYKSASTAGTVIADGIYKSNSAITSIDLSWNGGNSFDAGAYYLYGSN